MTQVEKLKEMLRRAVKGVHQDGCKATVEGCHYLDCNCDEIVMNALEEPEGEK